MKKEEFQELMYLSIYGELSEEEQSKLDAYLKKHPEAKTELQQFRKFSSLVKDNTTKNTSDDLLHDVRSQLRSALRRERNQTSFFATIIPKILELFSPKFAISGISALSLGVIIGYCSFSNSLPEQGLNIQPVSNSIETPDMTRIDNVRFIDSDASDGEIEFEFDAIAPMRLKGKINDPQIQNILTHALLNESNAGIRLKTVRAIAQQSEGKIAADPVVKATLIATLKSDENPGVRREALRVLQQYVFDDEIRDAVLEVLSKDSNSGMRVAAINALEIARMDGQKFDKKVAEKLTQQLETEQNSYIRTRAATLVKEIYQ
jgi:hypothetical protein